MKFLTALRLALAGLLAALPLLAAAQQVAYTAKPVHLRAGPDRVYPVVAVLPEGAQVVVQGCMVDYRWCDVTFGYERGWVYAGNLRYSYQGGYVPLVRAAPAVGIAVITFGVHDYWGSHYRDRPWYPDRDHWASPPRPRPRPAPHVRPAPAPGVHPAPAPRVQPPAPVRPPNARIHPPPRAGENRPVLLVPNR